MAPARFITKDCQRPKSLASNASANVNVIGMVEKGNWPDKSERIAVQTRVMLKRNPHRGSYEDMATVNNGAITMGRSFKTTRREGQPSGGSSRGFPESKRH